jgi:hypothetical protein
MKQRLDGYNRHDYYYPRSSREAFGYDGDADVSTFNMEETRSKSIYLIYILLAIILTVVITYFI